MQTLSGLSAKLFNAPLLIHPGAAQALATFFGGRIAGAPNPGAAAEHGNAQNGLAAEFLSHSVSSVKRFAGKKSFTLTDDGIAILPVLGPLVHRAGKMTPDCAPLASYQRLTSLHSAMLSDQDVRGILLEVDGPGGEAAGMFAFAERVIATRGVKPVWGHINEVAGSASYGLAAAVGRLHAPSLGRVGSIGVVLMHVDESKRDAKQGIVITPIYAGAKKVDGSSHAPLSERALVDARKHVDALYSQFTQFVASARSVRLKAVVDTQAAMLTGRDAKAIGLIDEISSFDDTLAAFADHLNGKPRRALNSGGTPAASHGGPGLQSPQAARHGGSAIDTPSAIAADVVGLLRSIGSPLVPASSKLGEGKAAMPQVPRPATSARPGSSHVRAPDPGGQPSQSRVGLRERKPD